jgi:hypothetical protein
MSFWLEVFGWAGSTLLVFSLLQARMLRLRVLNLVASLALVAYNAMVPVWPMVGMNLVVAAIDVYFIVQILRTRERTAEPEYAQG